MSPSTSQLIDGAVQSRGEVEESRINFSPSIGVFLIKLLIENKSVAGSSPSVFADVFLGNSTRCGRTRMKIFFSPSAMDKVFQLFAFFYWSFITLRKTFLSFSSLFCALPLSPSKVIARFNCSKSITRRRKFRISLESRKGLSWVKSLPGDYKLSAHFAFVRRFTSSPARPVGHHFEWISPLGLMNNNTLLDLFPRLGGKAMFYMFVLLAPGACLTSGVSTLSWPHTPGEIRYEMP